MTQTNHALTPDQDRRLRSLRAFRSLKLKHIEAEEARGFNAAWDRGLLSEMDSEIAELEGTADPWVCMCGHSETFLEGMEAHHAANATAEHASASRIAPVLA